jgi:catechol 2,3-dioxygenase-like lactoylglutathione lyase family enzyme
MKRFHVHVAVADLERSIGFYANLFGHAPSVRKPDYAKWMLEDPRLNFAISTRAGEYGVRHLGLQVDSREELDAVAATLHRAEAAVLTEEGATCCYARSDKNWVHDPDGVSWETFHSYGEATEYGSAPVNAGSAQVGARSERCCEPKAVASSADAGASACCKPSPDAKACCA